ncbi:expressed unknown protein [Seminavis robusta]|uniref:CAAX prenyl protease 2/Lysostaphin resistance protein A-like domain-containing protein n=1 Tax=Seminavis robusta TaxID=568900 RepID=A0A9N8DDZ3_9STRA|nr:expressed unknown protein [Seminavis robusta]|eukprot:Sro79_g042610.1 n/a (554) ;mRNA; f:6946-8607
MVSVPSMRSLLHALTVSWCFLVILPEVANAFPSSKFPRSSRATLASTKTSTSLSMSFSYQSFFQRTPPRKTSKTATAKQPKMLWYRDRDSTEEQMTLTHKAPALAHVRPRQEQSLPAARQDFAHDAFMRNNPTEENPASTLLKNLVGGIDLSLLEKTCLSHASSLAVLWTLTSMALIWGSGSMTAAMADPLDFWGSLHWNSNSAGIGLGSGIDMLGGRTFSSILDWTITPARILEGIIATVPLVGMGTYLVERSEHSPAYHIQFSISETVMELFGRRKRDAIVTSDASQSASTTTLQVLFFSLIIAAVSAISEELIFRGLIPALLVSYTHSVGWALLGQAILFGFGQIQNRSSFAENGVFTMMQCLNGVWYGAIYLAGGGDIVPVMISHILYEMHIFVGTWKAMNDQMDYKEDSCRHHTSEKKIDSLLASSQSRSRASKRAQRPKDLVGQRLMAPETLELGQAFFYAFDHEHRGTLSLVDVKRAVSYAFLQDDDPTMTASEPPSDVQTTAVFYKILQQRSALSGSGSEERLYLPEFLRLLFTLKSKSWHSGRE